MTCSLLIVALALPPWPVTHIGRLSESSPLTDKKLTSRFPGMTGVNFTIELHAISTLNHLKWIGSTRSHMDQKISQATIKLDFFYVNDTISLRLPFYDSPWWMLSTSKIDLARQRSLTDVPDGSHAESPEAHLLDFLVMKVTVVRIHRDAGFGSTTHVCHLNFLQRSNCESHMVTTFDLLYRLSLTDLSVTLVKILCHLIWMPHMISCLPQWMMSRLTTTCKRSLMV